MLHPTWQSSWQHGAEPAATPVEGLLTWCSKGVLSELRSNFRRALEGAAAACTMRVYQLSLQAAGTLLAAGKSMNGFRVCLTIRGVGLL